MVASPARLEEPGRRRRPALAVLAVVAALVAGDVALAATRRPVALDLTFEVIWGDESMGEESLREDVERQVLARLEQSACYASVVRARPTAGEEAGAPADLLFRLKLSDLEVREDWEVSIAERTSPNQPPGEAENRVLATIGFDVSMDLSLLPEAVSLRARDYRHEHGYRPLQQGEDPREEVRRLVIDDLARQATSFACKGATKLPAQIARTRAASD